MSVFARAPAGRLLGVAIAALAALALSACGGSSARNTIVAPVGTTAGVVLSTSTGGTQLQQGGTLNLTAKVSVDPNSQGVSWSLNGVGSLSAATTTTVTYNAPASGIIGTSAPIITATSVADSTQTANATLVVLGKPVINTPVLFPANVNSPYGASIVVSGGLGPFTWSLSGGTLPPGITLGSSTTYFTSLSGTPTAQGSFPIHVQVTDSNSPANVATVDVTLVVNGAAACLLNGQYALVHSGYIGAQMAVSAASLNVTSTGTISGYHDFNAAGSQIAESLTGTCTTRTANNGTLTLTGAANSPVYDYAVTTSFGQGRLQLMNGGDIQSAAGLFEKQDPAAFSQASLAGSFAFGLLGAQATDAHLGLAGALTLDAGGLVTDGHADSNGASPLSDAPLSGNLGAPDANGRGTLALTAGSQTFHFAYYIVNADRLLLVSTDAAPRFAGFMTRQGGGFSNTSLSGPAILSLWGAAQTAAPKSVLSLARLSNANATSGTVDLVLDTADGLTGTYDTPISGAAYAVRAADGRTTFSFRSGSTLRQFVAYLDSASNGYVIEQGSAVGSAGLLEAQMAGPFSPTVPGFFVSGTQYPQDATPMVLLPSVRLTDGAFSASSATGYYSLNATTGRAIGTISVTGSGSAVFVLYVVNANKVVTFRSGALTRSAVMDWQIAN